MRVITTHLVRARRLTSSTNGNPRWQFVTAVGTFNTQVDASCAYKGEARPGPITLKLNDHGSVIDYGWPQYPLGE